jgi:hypothetical protein
MAWGASGGGGGGGDSGSSADGSDGADADDSTLSLNKALMYLHGGAGGGGGKYSGANPTAYSAALLPIGTQGGRWPEYQLSGYNSSGGNGAGSGTGGAAGAKGEFSIGSCALSISGDLKAGGAGGAGGGSGTAGGAGSAASVIIFY